jgi:hypothetical protein
MPEAVERIIEVATGLPEPTADDPRDAEARRQELDAALEFATNHFFDTVAAIDFLLLVRHLDTLLGFTDPRMCLLD